MPDEWYYGQNGQQFGPVSMPELREKLANRSVEPGDLVWREGMSNWIPAAESRELCPQVASVVPAGKVPAPRAEAPVAQPEGRSASSPRTDWESRRSFRRRPQQQGMGTGAKVAIFGGIAAVVLVGLLFGVSMIVAIANMQPVAPRPPKFGGGGVAKRPVNVAPKRVVDPNPPPQVNQYTVALEFEKDQRDQKIKCQPNQKVRVTVTPIEWTPDVMNDLDVDVYILDNTGAVIAADTLPEPQCDVTFLAPPTGEFTIRVRLDRGMNAKCTVRY